MNAKPKYKDAYAAFHWKGQILTATIQFLKTDTEACLEKYNPKVDGYEYPYHIKKISVDQDMVPQLRLFDD